jgi:hypothetical protein
VETITLENRIYHVRYRVVTKGLKSLGLGRNPTILQYPIGEWYFLSDDKIKDGKDDVGGIWVTRKLSDAKKMSKYMKITMILRQDFSRQQLIEYFLRITIE